MKEILPIAENFLEKLRSQFSSEELRIFLNILEKLKLTPSLETLK